jgi:hypothetical protein
MVADHLLTRIGQAQTLSDLDYLLDNSTLAGIFNSWILSCLDRNYSPATIYHYRYEVTEFLQHIYPLNHPHDLAGRHVSLFHIDKAKTVSLLL